MRGAQSPSWLVVTVGAAVVLFLSFASRALAVDPNEAANFAQERGISVEAASQRLLWQERASALAADAEARLGGHFGGVWIDNQDGDRVKLGIAAGDAAAHNAASAAIVAARLQDGADTVDIEYSLADLEAAKAAVAADTTTANRSGIADVTVGLRPDLNAIQIDTPADFPLTGGQKNAVDRALKRYGRAVVRKSYTGRYQKRGCTYPYCDPPLRAGIRISDSQFSCTGGFLGRSRSDGVLYQFTSGHCNDPVGATWSTQFAGGSTHAIGPFHNSIDDNRGDAALSAL